MVLGTTLNICCFAIATVAVGDMCVQSNFTAIIICTTFRLLGWYNRGVLSQLPQDSHLPEVLLLFTYNVVIAVVVVGDVCTVPKRSFFSNPTSRVKISGLQEV